MGFGGLDYTIAYEVWSVAPQVICVFLGKLARVMPVIRCCVTLEKKKLDGCLMTLDMFVYKRILDYKCI